MDRPTQLYLTHIEGNVLILGGRNPKQVTVMGAHGLLFISQKYVSSQTQSKLDPIRKTLWGTRSYTLWMNSRPSPEGPGSFTGRMCTKENKIPRFFKDYRSLPLTAVKPWRLNGYMSTKQHGDIWRSNGEWSFVLNPSLSGSSGTHHGLFAQCQHVKGPPSKTW